MKQFKIPPISTLCGSTLFNFFRIIRTGDITPRYYLKTALTLIIILIASPFHLWEEIVFYKKLKKFRFKKPPLFIIGHWRSGTTLLHNMLCKDRSAAYLTTYHSVFPNNLASKWIFKTFMRLNTPEKRPSDNVKLDIDYPQEDEFAFANCQSNAYYNFFYFPKKYAAFYEKAIRHHGLTDEERNAWFNTYEKLLKKAAMNSGGERLIIKNPVNSARIKQLLKLFPDAKFLYIYRNPITVFLSTQRFFRSLFPTLQLQKADDQLINEIIFRVYKKLLNDYLAQKPFIPKGNLFELRFEEFEKDPVSLGEKIYSELLKEDFQSVKPIFSGYLKSIKDYKKNHYEIDSAIIELIYNHWGKFMDLHNYSVPNDVTVK
jgi:hypothetical protein